MHRVKFLQSRIALSRAKYLIIFFPVFVLLHLISYSKVTAQGNLMIFPKRVVFEGAKRYETINLANTGQETATYLISFVQIRMNEDGGFENIAEPDSGQRFADRFIRLFPRSVTLAPNEAQVIKVQLTGTNRLTPGEYRSHIYFRAEPDEKPLGEEEPLKDSTSISVSLRAVFGISIPVIIRVGESTAKVSLSELSFEMNNDTLPMLSMVFHRSGNMSVYGDITVTHISPQGETTEAGLMKGIAVYTPGLIRQAKLGLKNNLGINYREGKLRLVFTPQADDKNGQHAEAELQLR